MGSAHRLMTVLYICVVSSKYYNRVLELRSGYEYMVEMAIFNIYDNQRAVTPKVGEPELWFLCFARRLMVQNICFKFRENIMNGIRVMERTRVHGSNGYVQCSKGNNSVIRQTRVMVHVFCTLSYSALHWCEVSWKYLEQFQSNGANTKL